MVLQNGVRSACVLLVHTALIASHKTRRDIDEEIKGSHNGEREEDVADNYSGEEKVTAAKETFAPTD